MEAAVKKGIFAFWGLAALVLLLGRPVAGDGKAPTVRINVSGGGLGRAIEVTDPQLLAMSDVWMGEFLDRSRTPLKEAPAGLQAYEVSFYVKLAENDVRKMYVAYYYPNVRSEQGFLYLPGKGSVRQLNAGTIIRNGQDGNWNYAAPAWEALIKPAIADAEAAHSTASTSRANARENQNSSETSEVAADAWTKPQRGWLYILDPRSEPDHPGSRVWLLDPESGKVMGSIRAGSDPDFALSPDGERLYVASGERETGELDVVETATGNVTRVAFPDRILYKPWYEALPPFAPMAVSSDGRALRILVHHLFSPEKIEYQLWTFDTESERFLRAHVHLGNCGTGEFVASSAANQFDFLCPTTNRVRAIQVDAEYHEVSNTFVKLPWARTCGVAEGFFSPEGNKLEIIRGDGAIYEMDARTQEFSSTAAGGDCRPLVYPLSWPRSPDGTKAYIGYGPFASDGMATSRELRIFDTATWQQLGSVHASFPFWSAVAGNDGRFVYALVPEQQAVLVIDAATLQETRTISAGRTPTLALVAP
jgi:DNA-binding beta-propeller fold protein YncE